MKLQFFQISEKNYNQGIAGFTSGQAPAESFPIESIAPEKERVQITFYEDELTRVVEGLAHTWVALSTSGVCSAVLPLFFLLPTESETSPRYSDMF